MDFCVLNNFLLVLWISFIAPAICNLSEEEVERIDMFIKQAMKCNNIPGLTLSVVNRDWVLLQKGYGIASDDGRNVTEDTLFPIASTTKAFTTTLLAMLLKKSTYTWDTPVKQIIPGFKLHNKLLTEQVTLRDILTHRTGIPGYFVALMAGFPEDMSLSDFVRDFRYHKPKESFRTHFIYNNYMYALAGRVAEVLGGKKWQELIREYIFTPLNMTSSSFVSQLDALNQTNLAKAFAHNNVTNVQIDMEAINQVNIADAAGGILSTATDMAKWMQFHLNNGVTPSGERLLGPREMHAMYRSYMGSAGMLHPAITRPDFPVEDISIGYGLGWVNSIYRGYWRVWHSGGILTYKSQVWLFFDLKFGIFLEANGPQSGSWAMIHIAQYIFDILANEEPWVNLTTVCTFPEPWKTRHPKSPVDFPNDPIPLPEQHYIGRYTHPAFGDVTIFHNETSNKLSLKMGRFIESVLGYDEHKNVFMLKFINSYWYLTELIPVKITTPVCTNGNKPVMSVLEMPLYNPYNDAMPIVFHRNIEQGTTLSKGGKMSSSYVMHIIALLLVLVCL